MEVLPVSKDVLAGMPHSLDTGALRKNTQKLISNISVEKEKYTKENIVQIYCLAQYLFLTEKRWILKLFW